MIAFINGMNYFPAVRSNKLAMKYSNMTFPCRLYGWQLRIFKIHNVLLEGWHIFRQEINIILFARFSQTYISRKLITENTIV